MHFSPGKCLTQGNVSGLLTLPANEDRDEDTEGRQKKKGKMRGRKERKTDRKMRCLGLIPNWNLTSLWGWRLWA